MLLHGSQLGKRKYVTESEFRTNCIFCNDKKQHLYVNVKLGVFHCFKCGVSGKFTESDTYQPNVYYKQKHDNKITDVNELHLQYLYNRGLKLDDVILYKPISYTQYPQYVFSDLSNPKVGRNIFDLEPKYIKIGNLMSPWGCELLPKELTTLVIVEGVFDYIAVKNYANLHVVALLGKTMSLLQKTYLISLKVKKIVIFLDKDAKDFAYKLYTELRLWKDVEIRYPNDDPWNDRYDLTNILGGLE